MNRQDNVKKQIAVLGAGAWVRDQYAPALKPYCEAGGCELFIVYDSRYGGATYNDAIAKNVRGFERWGAICLDIANLDAQEKVERLEPLAVFVVTPDATHCDMVEDWLDRADSIIVEKPFDVDHKRIRELRANIDRYSCTVRGFDHYLVRANQFAKGRDRLAVDRHLEWTLKSFTLHMLEADDRRLVGRQASLRSGMVLDMGVHGIALLSAFGDPVTIQLRGVKAGVYEPNKGITTSGRELLPSGMETFAEIRFDFTSIYGEAATGIVRVGKCVGERDEKYVEIVGGKDGNRKIRLDMQSLLVDFSGGGVEGPITSLFCNPVHLLVREVIGERANKTLALFTPAEAERIIEAVNDWRDPIIARVRKGGELDPYPGGESLDTILKFLQPLEL